MNVEDSYEGAMRRLQRLEMAGFAMEPAPADSAHPAAPDAAERMRELEELAMLACEENERLKGELASVTNELETTRHENEQLRAYVVSLQQQQSGAQPALASAPDAGAANPQPPPAKAARAPSPFAPSPFAADALPDEDYGYPPRSSNRRVFYFFVLAVVGIAIAALLTTRPWERPHTAQLPVEPPVPAPAPSAPPPPPAATATAPVVPPPAHVEPTLPKLAPAIPKATATKVAPPVAGKRAAHRHVKRHAKKHHAVAKTKSAEAEAETSDDPLAGIKP